jgi:hypothetical protein
MNFFMMSSVDSSWAAFICSKTLPPAICATAPLSSSSSEGALLGLLPVFDPFLVVVVAFLRALTA